MPLKLSINLAAFVWLCGYVTMSWGATTLGQDIRGYDLESFAWAGFAGFLGWFGHGLVATASQRKIVWRIPIEMVWDIVIGVMAGIAAYVVIQGTSSFINTYLNLPVVPKELRILLLTLSGWMGVSFFGQMDKIGTAAGDTIIKRIGEIQIPAGTATGTKEG